MKKVIIFVIIIILCLAGYFGVKYFLDKDLEKQKQELQDTINKYGTVEKESISSIVHKFNTELNNAKDLNYADDKYTSVSDNLYWYGLYEDIYCYLKPIEFTDNKDNDIADVTTIHFKKGSKNEETALKYVKYLIKANNSKLTDDEIKALIDDAKRLSTENKKANNSKGISIDLVETEEVVEYHITRLYDNTK